MKTILLMLTGFGTVFTSYLVNNTTHNPWFVFIDFIVGTLLLLYFSTF